jgi:hypothetical protein
MLAVDKITDTTFLNDHSLTICHGTSDDLDDAMKELRHPPRLENIDTDVMALIIQTYAPLLLLSEPRHRHPRAQLGNSTHDAAVVTAVFACCHSKG